MALAGGGDRRRRRVLKENGLRAEVHIQKTEDRSQNTGDRIQEIMAVVKCKIGSLKRKIAGRFKELYLTSDCLSVARVKRILEAEGFDRGLIRGTVGEVLNAAPGPVRVVEHGEYDSRTSRLVSGPAVAERSCDNGDIE